MDEKAPRVAVTVHLIRRDNAASDVVVGTALESTVERWWEYIADPEQTISVDQLTGGEWIIPCREIRFVGIEPAS